MKSRHGRIDAKTSRKLQDRLPVLIRAACSDLPRGPSCRAAVTHGADKLAQIPRICLFLRWRQALEVTLCLSIKLRRARRLHYANAESPFAREANLKEKGTACDVTAGHAESMHIPCHWSAVHLQLLDKYEPLLVLGPSASNVKLVDRLLPHRVARRGSVLSLLSVRMGVVQLSSKRSFPGGMLRNLLPLALLHQASGACFKHVCRPR